MCRRQLRNAHRRTLGSAPANLAHLRREGRPIPLQRMHVPATALRGGLQRPPTVLHGTRSKPPQAAGRPTAVLTAGIGPRYARGLSGGGRQIGSSPGWPPLREHKTRHIRWVVPDPPISIVVFGMDHPCHLRSPQAAKKAAVFADRNIPLRPVPKNVPSSAIAVRRGIFFALNGSAEVGSRTTSRIIVGNLRS